MNVDRNNPPERTIDPPPYRPNEMMVIAASRALNSRERVLVGIGLPNLAASLAKRLHAPDLVLLYESGVVDAEPTRTPLAIADPCLVSGAAGVMSMLDFFALVLQGGHVDVGFLGGAQVDRFGNINSTAIGSYHRPTVRLPGSGGACEIATLAKRLIIVVKHDRKRLPGRVDFVTSPGFLGGRAERDDLDLPGGGPAMVITDLGVLGFDDVGEMRLDAIYPGVTIDTVRENTGWDLLIADEVATVPPPTTEELRILREDLDADGTYLERRRRRGAPSLGGEG